MGQRHAASARKATSSAENKTVVLERGRDGKFAATAGAWEDYKIALEGNRAETSPLSTIMVRSK